MTTPASPDHAEPWYLLGAGNMGLLAAHYLQRAGFTVIALRRDDAPTLERTLILPNGDPVPLQLRCQRPPASETEPLVGAGPAREREQSSRQDPRDISNGKQHPLWHPAGRQSRPFACKASSHKAI